MERWSEMGLTRGTLQGLGRGALLGGAASLASARLACVAAAVAVLLACVCAGGCALRSGKEFRPAFVDEGEAVVYVFRAQGGVARGLVEVYVNQRPVGVLRSGEYLAWTTRPGEQIVRVESDSSAAARVHVQAGESAYLHVMTDAFGGKPRVEPRAEDEALRMLARTRRGVALE